MYKLLASCDDYCYSVNGKYYLRPFGSTLFNRYLSVFDKVRVVVRTKYVSSEEELGAYCEPIDPNIEIVPICFFQGPMQLLQSIRTIKEQLSRVTDGCDACIVRLPSSLAFMVHQIAKKRNMPIGIEVVANPKELSQSGSLLSRLCWKYLHYKLKSACATADVVSYVTEYTLQKIYPAKKADSYTTHYSSVELPLEYFTSYRSGLKNGSIILCHVAHPINNMSKGHDVFIEVIKKLRDSGYNVIGKIVGEGIFSTYYKEYAVSLGIEEYVDFMGFLNAQQLHQLYIESNIMLFPTLTEGLPRVVIEAMATGLPCLSTPVGGIPELLSEKDMFCPKDVDGFVQRIIELVSDGNVYETLSKTNFEKARRFSSSVLSSRRVNMFAALKSKIIENNK